jgi:hypothetical protein
MYSIVVLLAVHSAGVIVMYSTVVLLAVHSVMVIVMYSTVVFLAVHFASVGSVPGDLSACHHTGH